MALRLPELAANVPSATCGVVGLVFAVVLFARRSQAPDLRAFPAAGSSSWLGSWWTAWKYVTDAQSIVQEGYVKFKSAPFKIAEFYRWTVIISDQRCVEELARASDDVFSFVDAIDDQIQTRYTLGQEINENPYHIEAVRSQLTRNIQKLYPEMRDEIVTSFEEFLDLKGNEWKSVPVLKTSQKIVCRTTNRLFVGLPLCRNPDWMDLNIRYTTDVITGGIIIGLFPTCMRALATRFVTNIPRNLTRGVKLLGPIIGERQKYIKEYGVEWDDKPNDLLSWLMDRAEGPELSPRRLTNRLLVVNFASIHSTSNSFSQALFYLAANPQYIQPLREEVENIVKEDGWSKAAVGKMRKVDSFLRECQRIEGLNIVTVTRKAMKDYMFSDGTLIPKGTLLAAATMSLHHDESLYKDPDAFQPFRFADMREEDGKGTKYQFASTTTEYLPFGHGKHACPGRFLAASELKTILAHIVVTYDVKLEDNATSQPKSQSIGTFISADANARVMFRNRVK